MANGPSAVAEPAEAVPRRPPPATLAANEILALVGWLEVRDWVDAVECCERLQPLGFLAWAACGNNPGFSPLALIEHAARTTRYSSEEVRALSFAGPPPDAVDLSRRWHAQLAEAHATIAALPGGEAGTCILDPVGGLFRGGAAATAEAVSNGALRFHAGSIRGHSLRFGRSDRRLAAVARDGRRRFERGRHRLLPVARAFVRAKR